MSVELTTRAAAETEHIGEIIGQSARGGDLIALEGELGAGKTCLVRGIARGMGFDPALVSSPTFIIRQDYLPAQVASGHRLIHVDAYRISSIDELDSIGWDEMVGSPDAVIAVEWPDRIEPALPPQRLWVKLEHAGADSRRVQIVGAAPYQQVLDRLSDYATLAGQPGDTRDSPGKCPTCGSAIGASTSTFPFCSSRCRMADLGRWFAGRYRISRAIQATDDDDEISR